MDHSLKGEEPQLAYVGFLREHQKDVIASIESTVFTHWDSLPSSPPKTRARAESRINVSGLQLLSCDSAGRPGFPDHVMGKFAPGSAQHKKLCEIKEAFQREFPASAGRDGGAVTTPGTVPRASGECDFSIDDGKEPLSVERVVELSYLPSPPEPADRTVVANCSGVEIIFLWVMFCCYIFHYISCSCGGVVVVFFWSAQDLHDPGKTWKANLGYRQKHGHLGR